MTIIQSVFLGIVQGLTEFLPVSSSGHLAILRNLFGIEADGGMLFDALLHLGTMVAIFMVFRKDLLRMAGEILCMGRDLIYNGQMFVHNKRERDARRYRKLVHNNYRRFVVMVLVSAIPTAVIGYAAADLVQIAEVTLIAPGVCLILNSGLLLVADAVEAGKKVPKDITFTNAFLIGMAQGISVLPGLSRSGTTITACLMSGYDRRFAVKYSFIMSIPAVIGASLYEICRMGADPVSFGQMAMYLTGAVAAGAAGYFSIRKMLGIVRKKKFKGFALYCLIIGIAAIAGHFLTR